MSFTAPNLGVVVTTNEIPPPSGVPTNTATAFVIGEAPWGPTSYARVTSLTDFTATFAPGGRASMATPALYDTVDTLTRLGVPQIYVARVLGPAPVQATLALNDSGAHPTLNVTADYPGSYGNSLLVSVTVSGGTFVITLTDTNGNVIATSPSLSTQAAAITWSQTAPYITLTASTASGATTNNPTTLAATALTGGTSNYSAATLATHQAALANFSFALGPGQVLAPGQTNTTLNGIWSALLSHAATNNRFACLDLDSASRPATVSAVSAINSAAYASYGIFDQPTALIPGINGAPPRTVAASAVRAGLCAQVDGLGNPNRAAAGRNFPIPYVIGFNWYGGAQTSDSDVLLLNQAGVNTFELRYGVFESFGFNTPALPATEPIYWQASASRLRMALVADAYQVGEPFVFSQLDGRGATISAFGGAIASMLQGYYLRGALYAGPGQTANDAFSVNVGPTVNTPATIAAGELKAAVAFRISPTAQMVELDLSAVPTSQQLPAAA